ncbi:TPA: Fatty acyl-CoA reductase 2 [Trebouxia sp. C0005]
MPICPRAVLWKKGFTPYMTMASQLTKPQSTCLLQHFGYLNTYLLSKTLTERMVMEHHQASFSVCIVSRALCGAVAGLPCPGYIGNTSGATAAILAVATGTGSDERVRNRKMVDRAMAEAVQHGRRSLHIADEPGHSAKSTA